MNAAVLKPGQFFGRVARKYSAGGATLSEVRHPRPRRVPVHGHEACYFCHLLGGDYSETFNDETIQYSLRSIAFHPPGTVHRGEIGAAGGRLFAIELDGRWLERVREIAPPRSFSYYRAGGELAWLAARLHKEYQNGDSASGLMVEGILLEMLAEISRKRPGEETGSPRWLAVALEFLRAEFRRSLTLDEVAKHAGVHPAHLSRVFRRRYGKSVGEYVNEMRVRFAVQELAKDVPLSDLSLAAGFADQSHFTRIFRSVTGTTPARFRAAQRTQN